MRVYYLDAEYETGKHKIVEIWAESLGFNMPDPGIREPHSVLELDELHNRPLAQKLLHNTDMLLGGLPDKYYVDAHGTLRDNNDNSITIVPNPQKEAYKLSALYGMSQAELETYIENNVTDLASAKELFKKIGAVVLHLVKQSRLD